MTNDLDRDLRELFRRHEGDMADRGLAPPPTIARRTRRRQAITLFMVSIAASAVAVAGFAGLDAIRASDRQPADPGPGPKIDWERVPSVTIDEDAIANVRTGEVSQLPASITSLGATQGYLLAPAGDMLVFHASTGSSTNNIVTSCGGGNDGSPPFRACQIFVANLDGTDIRQVTDIPGGATAGGWSPDGTKIVAYLDGDGRRTDIELVLIDVATGETTQLASGPAGDFQEPHFDLDGQRVLISRFQKYRDLEAPYPEDEGSDVYAILAEGGEPSLVFEDRWNATFSPDGSTIAYERMFLVEFPERVTHGRVAIWLADADGTDRRPLLPAEESYSRSPSTRSASWSPDSTRIVFTRSPEEWLERSPEDGSMIAIGDVASGRPTFVVRAPGSPIAVWLDNDTVLVDIRK
jgi:WD40-like Beta Propeller Repeat